MAEIFVLIVLTVVIFTVISDQISSRKTKPQNLPPISQEKHSVNGGSVAREP